MNTFWFDLFNFVSLFGSEKAVIILATLISLIVLFAYQKKRVSAFIFSNYAITALIVVLLKLIIQKPRNSLALVLENTYAFPSGHTALATTTSLLLFYLSKFVKNKNLKIFMNVFGFLWLALMVAARLYLKVHDVSDVVTSILFSILIFFLLLKLRIFRKDLLKKEFEK